jgi:beta-phosphoglucomutase
MIRAVCFDFNGVLVDDENVHFELLRDILAEDGIILTEREYHDLYLGYDDRGCFEVALASAGLPAGPERIEALIAQKAQSYRSRAETGLRIFPGAAESLQALARRFPIAICSGALRPEIEFALERLRSRDYVSVIISAEDTTHCKPDPEGYSLSLAALRLLPGKELHDLKPSECLVVEDSLAGIASARAAGMWCVGVAHTYKPGELTGAGAHRVIQSLDTLAPEWIDTELQSLTWRNHDV